MGGMSKSSSPKGGGENGSPPTLPPAQPEFPLPVISAAAELASLKVLRSSLPPPPPPPPLPLLSKEEAGVG